MSSADGASSCSWHVWLVACGSCGGNFVLRQDIVTHVDLVKHGLSKSKGASWLWPHYGSWAPSQVLNSTSAHKALRQGPELAGTQSYKDPESLVHGLKCQHGAAGAPVQEVPELKQQRLLPTVEAWLRKERFADKAAAKQKAAEAPEKKAAPVRKDPFGGAGRHMAFYRGM